LENGKKKAIRTTMRENELIENNSGKKKNGNI
jgi:hypothetical protein